MTSIPAGSSHSNHHLCQQITFQLLSLLGGTTPTTNMLGVFWYHSIGSDLIWTLLTCLAMSIIALTYTLIIQPHKRNTHVHVLCKASVEHKSIC